MSNIEISRNSFFKKDFFDVSADFANEKPFALAKAVCVAIDCLRKADLIPQGQEKIFDSVSYHSNLIKLSVGPGDFINNTNILRNRVADWMKDPSLKGLTQTIRAANSCVLPAWDITDFFTNTIFYIAKESVETFRGISASCLVLARAWDALDRFYEIAHTDVATQTGKKKKLAYHKITQALIELAKHISYIVVGVLTILSIFFQIVAAPVVFTALAASTVVFTFLEFYHERLFRIV